MCGERSTSGMEFCEPGRPKPSLEQGAIRKPVSGWGQRIFLNLRYACSHTNGCQSSLRALALANSRHFINVVLLDARFNRIHLWSSCVFVWLLCTLALSGLILVPFVLQVPAMLHRSWCTTLDCHHLSQVILHLRPGIYFTEHVTSLIVSFLEFPVLSILAKCQPFELATKLRQTDSKIRYLVWNASCQPVEFCHYRFELDWEDDWMITCNVDSMNLITVYFPLHVGPI